MRATEAGQDGATKARLVERVAGMVTAAAVLTVVGYLASSQLTGRARPLDLSFWLFPAALCLLPLGAWTYHRFLVWSIHRADGRPRSAGRHSSGPRGREVPGHGEGSD